MIKIRNTGRDASSLKMFDKFFLCHEPLLWWLQGEWRK